MTHIGTSSVCSHTPSVRPGVRPGESVFPSIAVRLSCLGFGPRASYHEGRAGFFFGVMNEETTVNEARVVIAQDEVFVFVNSNGLVTIRSVNAMGEEAMIQLNRWAIAPVIRALKDARKEML